MRRIVVLAAAVVAAAALWIAIGLTFVRPSLGVPALILTVTALVWWAKRDNRRHYNAPPAADEWHLPDEEEPEEPSETERQMLAYNEKLDRQRLAEATRRDANRILTEARWAHINLTPEQREVAADDARWKRVQDGMGDL